MQPQEGVHQTPERLAAGMEEERQLLLFLIEVAVLRDEVAPLAGNGKLVKNSVDRAHRFAVRAVDTGNGVYEVLFLLVIGVDAVNGTNLNAGSVLYADARFSYHEWHILNPTAESTVIGGMLWHMPRPTGAAPRRMKLASFSIWASYFVKG